MSMPSQAFLILRRRVSAVSKDAGRTCRHTLAVAAVVIPTLAAAAAESPWGAARVPSAGPARAIGGPARGRLPAPPRPPPGGGGLFAFRPPPPPPSRPPPTPPPPHPFL